MSFIHNKMQIEYIHIITYMFIKRHRYTSLSTFVVLLLVQDTI